MSAARRRSLRWRVILQHHIKFVALVDRYGSCCLTRIVLGGGEEGEFSPAAIARFAITEWYGESCVFKRGSRKRTLCLCSLRSCSRMLDEERDKDRHTCRGRVVCHTFCISGTGGDSHTLLRTMTKVGVGYGQGVQRFITCLSAK